MNDYFIASEAFHKLFAAEMLALAAILVLLIPALGWIAAPIMLVVAALFQLFALYDARSVHPGFQMAFNLVIAGLVVSVVNFFLPDGTFLASVADIIAAILSFGTVYYICTAGEDLLEGVDGALADRAALLWKLYAGCTVVTVINAIVAGVTVLEWLMSVVSAVFGIVSLVAYILLIIFYNQASKALSA